MKMDTLRFATALTLGKRFAQNSIPRVESLPRSRRRESALASMEFKVRGLTSAATRFAGMAGLTIILVFGSNAMAADVSAEFNSANELYAKGKFAEAAGAYEKILQSGAVSPALYFNYGNAEFKSGNLGRAIATYRRAAKLAPRDAEVRANLDFARSQVQGPVLRENRWSRLAGRLDFFTLNEWTGLTAAALWLMFGLLAARQIRPSLKPVLGGLTKLAVAAAILVCTCLGVNAGIHFSKQIAVVVASDAVARSGPFDEAQNAFAVHDGAELAVVDRKNGWWEVTDGSGRIGWLPQKQVEILPGS
jgi:tetratricopeptide (TPR) repeat protein